MASERTSPLQQRERNKTRERSEKGERGRKQRGGKKEREREGVEKGRRGRARESRCILALSLFATIYFMIHTRSLTVAMAHQARGVLSTVAGQAEKCDIL